MMSEHFSLAKLSLVMIEIRELKSGLSKTNSFPGIILKFGTQIQ